jgi:DNA-binding NtrC family response regulator
MGNESEKREPHVVVLVEEEADEREAIAAHLTDAGFTVLAAEDTAGGRELLERESAVAALVTDAHVPGPIDGFELAAEARRRLPEIAVVMTSGHSDETSGPLPEGAVFVGKAYLTARLVPALREMLAGR